MSASAYTGDVEVGGPADVRELPGLTISKLAVSEMANNAYLLRCTATGEALLIDAAAEPEALLRADRRRRRCAPSSPRTGTGTTTARCPTSSRRPAR